MRRVVAWILAVVIVCQPLQAVLAQDGSGTGNVPGVVQIGTDPRGVPIMGLDPNQWTPGEPITVNDPTYFDGWGQGATPPEWPLPGGGTFCLGCAVYNTYTGPNGETIVVPNLGTSILIGLGIIDDPFNGAKPDAYQLDPVLTLMGLAGGLDSLGISRDDVVNGDWSKTMLLMLTVNNFMNGLTPEQRQLYENNITLRSGILVFNSDNCPPLLASNGLCDAPVPGNNGNGSDPNNPFIAICLARGDCVVPWEPTKPRDASSTPCFMNGRDLKITIPDLQYIVDVPAPENPVVVGQDQTSKRGVDLFVQVTAPVVTMSVNNTYKVREWDECKWLGDGTGGGCNDHPGDVNWGTERKEEWECHRDSYIFPDVLDRIRVTADLSAASIAWITTGDLQQRYPGARVYQSRWALWPGFPPRTSGVSADGTQITFEWASIPFRDPGTYAVTVTGRTLGTPYTAPRLVMSNDRTFQVALFEGALTK